MLAWVDANTNEYDSDFTDNDPSDQWCEDCKKPVKFEKQIEKG
jgi:hypothetical protein